MCVYRGFGASVKHHFETKRDLDLPQTDCSTHRFRLRRVPVRHSPPGGNEWHFRRLSQRNARSMAMPTPSGHTTAILASKVKGTPVYNSNGDRNSTVEDIVLDKMSDNIMFAVLGSGGMLGMGEKFRPIPWSILDYDPDKGGYVVPVSKEVLENAPSYRMEDLTSD